MLGPLRLCRHGAPRELPASRKVRGLLAYLALAPRPVPRGQLCALLWDVPDDPRGELRWCLSKIRRLVDEPGAARVVTAADTVALDLSGCAVDAGRVALAARRGVAALATAELRALAGAFAGEVLEDLAIDRSPAFTAWLTAQRRRFRACRAALLEELVGRVPDDERLGLLEPWLALAPLDPRVHALLLAALARQGLAREGEEHLAAAVRLFEAEGLDAAPLDAAWRAARDRREGAPPARAAAPEAGRDDAGPPAPRRASVAVMPFADAAAVIGSRGGTAHALAHDVITRLAKLRTLLVIAQGTVFALDARRVGPEEAGRMLNVDYVVGGSVRRHGARLAVAVELVEARTARIVWAEVFDGGLDATLEVLDAIGDGIVASVAGEIEACERNRAILRPPHSLDAWEAHHRGLWHMYRFNRPDNGLARHFLEVAVGRDPTFARAHAALSFTHFQDAFQGWAPRERAADLAFAAAGQSLMADDRDPAAHWAMGRALWLRGRHAQSLVELDQAVALSPNFAQGHYALAFVHSQTGDPEAAIASSDHSRRLSPFDPLLFGMLGARAMALVRLGRFEEAAEWGMRAAARPNAHAHIQAIAALSLALAGRLDEARAHLAVLRRDAPHYRAADFLAAMQFAPEGVRLFRDGAERIGMG
ncbi:transcriptional regulator [Methylobacterium crusticola]|nr:transcriptional regulator [Methylobacterium crusticola]